MAAIDAPVEKMDISPRSKPDLIFANKFFMLVTPDKTKYNCRIPRSFA
jgi:hypothetical protein